MFTGNIDCDYQILNYLDPQDLSKTSRINKYTQEILHDANYWTCKLENENFPLVFNTQDYTLVDWLNLYKDYTIGKKEAENTLMVYNIQYNNITKPPIYIYDLCGNLAEYVEELSCDKINYISIYFDKEYEYYVFEIHEVDSSYRIIRHENKDGFIRLLIICNMFNIGEHEIDILCDNVPLIIKDIYAYSNRIEGERYGILKTIEYYKR